MGQRAEVLFLTILADTIREMDQWPRDDLTADGFMKRLAEVLEDSCTRDLHQIEYLESAVRSLHVSLIRSLDLLRDPKTPVRTTHH